MGNAAKVNIREDGEGRDRRRRCLRKPSNPTQTTEVDGKTIRITFTAAFAGPTGAMPPCSSHLEIIRRRIDETGVREPTIQRQGDERILLQVPGVDDPERLKELIGKTAKMTFHLVHERNIDQDYVRVRRRARAGCPAQDLGRRRHARADT